MNPPLPLRSNDDMRHIRALGHQALVLTVRETADQLKTSEWTVHKLIRERQLGSIKVGARRLVPWADLEMFIEARRQPVHPGGNHVT